MAIHRTIDHDEIREWAESHGARPAIAAGTAGDESDGDPVLSFSRSDPNATPVEWQEFFSIFEAQKLRFHYEDPLEDGEQAEWAYGFDDRNENVDSSEEDEEELPEVLDYVEENMFPSSPAAPDEAPDDAVQPGGEDQSGGEDLA